jgi:hypothetical protein
MLNARVAQVTTLALTLAGMASTAAAENGAEALARPTQLTVGVGDQLLGQVDPGGKTLYFVADRNATREIFAQDLAEARARLLFDEGADVTWPRVSPDGRRLLYISYRDHATGQLCVRTLAKIDERACLAGDDGALQAEWVGATRIVLVSRTSVDGDLKLLSVRAGAALSASPLAVRNGTSPTISPDGRWLVYVPVERYVPQVGPAFAARAAANLEAVRLDGSDAPQRLQLDLPGVTGQPHFSADGRHLYAVQFFNDSNHDGVLDGNDHGVVFRVAFDPGAADAPARANAAMPEQLTDAHWNCQYPQPARQRLVLTCRQGKLLNVYDLPVEGAVPRGFSAARIELELELASHPSEKLLLYRAALARASAADERERLLGRLLRLHLELDEFAAAEFYAHKLADTETDVTRGMSHVALVLVAQRAAERERERGRDAAEFRGQSRARDAELAARTGDGVATAALAEVVRTEIACALGDMSAAREALERVNLAAEVPAFVLDLFADRADALYRELDDAQALAAVERRLDRHPALALPERLRYARAAARALVRGLAPQAAQGVLARERIHVGDDAEFAFALDLESAATAIAPGNEEAATAQLLALFGRQDRVDRKRAVMLDAVERASNAGVDSVVEALAQAYVEQVPRGTQERRRAERLYRQVIEGRGFGRFFAGRREEARADFDQVVTHTGSLDSLVESIEITLRVEGVTPGLAERYAGRVTGAASHFGRAYVENRVLAREAALPDAARAARIDAAIAELRLGWSELRGNYVAQTLYGALLHERFLVGREVATAERAIGHYLVALNLVRTDVRYRAALLGQLGLLHTQVGNYRIALDYLTERDKLPYAVDAAGLCVHLARARALLHVGRDADAAQVADRALAEVDGTPGLGRFRPLVLDRAALYNLAAGRWQRALALYDLAVAAVPAAETDAQGKAHNHLAVTLAHAAAALGASRPEQALADLDAFERALTQPRMRATLVWPHTAPADVMRAYGIIAAGLRANAEIALGRLAEAGQTLERRHRLFVERFARSDRDEDLRAIVLCEGRLAEVARERGDLHSAARWVGEAWHHAVQVLRRAALPVDHDQVMVLRLAAELQAEGVAMPFDITKEVARLHKTLAARVEGGETLWRGEERWLELYLPGLAGR